MKRWCKFLYPILFIHLLACARAPKNRVASIQGEMPTEKPFVAAAGGTETVYEAPLDKFSKETWSSEIYLLTSRKEFPKIIDAPAGAKDEEEIPAEEGGDGKQNVLETALDFYQASRELWSHDNLEAAINSLDEAYSLILKVSSDSDPAMIQEKEDLRILISRRLIEIYA